VGQQVVKKLANCTHEDMTWCVTTGEGICYDCGKYVHVEQTIKDGHIVYKKTVVADYTTLRKSGVSMKKFFAYFFLVLSFLLVGIGIWVKPNELGMQIACTGGVMLVLLIFIVVIENRDKY
jgi:hypothetical protein